MFNDFHEIQFISLNVKSKLAPTMCQKWLGPELTHGPWLMNC